MEYILMRDIKVPKLNLLKKGRENIECITQMGNRIYAIVDRSYRMPFKKLKIKALIDI
jgi:hypothetical protein